MADGISNGGEDIPKSYAALKFIEEAQHDEKPWFLTVSYNQPHDIYAVKRSMRQDRFNFDLENIELPKNFIDDLSTKPVVQALFRDEDQGEALKDFTEEDWKYYIAYYNYLVEFLDQQIGKLIDKLKETNQFKNTIFVFTSDHGDMMASHGTPYKGPMMYDELIKIPLIISWPGVIPANQERNQLSTNVDHFPTICDLLDLEIPEEIDGKSLKIAIFENESIDRDFVVVEYYSKQKWINPIRTLVNDKYKYNLYLSGEEELYDLQEDSSEIKNLAGKEDYEKTKAKLKENLINWIKKNADPFFTYDFTDRDGNLFEG
ncbi:sulfatase family protein [Natronospora cellulosivora (SeqCode)]